MPLMGCELKITRVWIDYGCIACDSCETLCPDVFEVQEETCVIRPEALAVEFTKPRTDAIRDAAKECPVDVIKFETVEEDDDEDEQATSSADALSRRRLITGGSVAAAAITGSAALSALAGQRFLFPNVPGESEPVLRVGPIDRYASLPAGCVSEAARSDGIWIVRLADRLVACSRTCTHLGCPTRWDATDGRFKCPCHGSVFAPDGTNLDGPAPRALERLGIRRQGDVVVVDRRRRFVKERGQWDDPDSYLSV
jgi:cytochrome b6-f complex iron-sulfur subunit